MRWVWWLGWGLIACRPPALPPVPAMPPTDAVPARARHQLLVAQLALAAGDAEAARLAASRAARFDSTGAPPLVVLAQARAATGDSVGALDAVTKAVSLAPDALLPRVVRLGLDPQGTHLEADVQAILRHSPEERRPYLAPLGDHVSRSVALSEVVLREVRLQVYGVRTPRLLDLWPVLRRHETGLAVVVAAVRLHAEGAATADVRAHAVAVLSASGCEGGRWSPLPPEWSLTPLERDPVAPVGYGRGPDDDVGWKLACSGDRMGAMDHLTSAWLAAPHSLTLREQLWLTQRGSASK